MTVRSRWGPACWPAFQRPSPTVGVPSVPIGSRERGQAACHVHRPTTVGPIQYTPTSAAELRRTLTDWNTVWWAGAHEELRIATPQGSKPCWYATG